MLRNLKNQNNQSYIEDITLSSELQFLIACCQVEPNLKEILSLSLKIKNWEELISMASRHGILPLVYKTLKIKELAIDTEVLRELKNRYLNISKKNMLMSAELIRIMKLLNDHNIKALAFKGPTLSQMIYGDITLRQYGDLDIFIQEESKQKILYLLLENGYTDILNLTPEQKTVWYSNAKEINLYHSKKTIYIDLQWQFFDKDYPLYYNYDILWKTALVGNLYNHSISTFSKESLLIYLSVHGSKHLFERIGWIKDIDLLIRQHSIDWKYIDSQLENNDFKRMFLLSLYLSKQFFNTPILDKYIKEYECKNWIKPVHTFIVQNWIDHKNFIYNTIAMLYLFPTFQHKLGYLKKIIFKPSKHEYRFLILPKKLHWIYYFIRPFLLLKKYFISILQSISK